MSDDVCGACTSKAKNQSEQREFDDKNISQAQNTLANTQVSAVVSRAIQQTTTGIYSYVNKTQNTLLSSPSIGECSAALWVYDSICVWWKWENNKKKTIYSWSRENCMPENCTESGERRVGNVRREKFSYIFFYYCHWWPIVLAGPAFCLRGTAHTITTISSHMIADYETLCWPRQQKKLSMFGRQITVHTPTFRFIQKKKHTRTKSSNIKFVSAFSARSMLLFFASTMHVWTHHQHSCWWIDFCGYWRVCGVVFRIYRTHQERSRRDSAGSEKH